jgi:hypothetical protein
VLCNECGRRVGRTRSRWSNGLAYCPNCMKQRKKRLAARKRPGALQMSTTVANRIIAVPPIPVPAMRSRSPR